MTYKKKKSRNVWNLNLVLLFFLCGIFLFESFFRTNTFKNGAGQINDNKYENIKINRFDSLLESIYKLLHFEYNIYDNYNLPVNENKDLKDLLNIFYSILMGSKKLDVIKITPISHVFKDPIKTDKYHLLGYIYQFKRAYAQINYKANPCFFFVKNLSNNQLEYYFILSSGTIVEEVHYPESIKEIAIYLDEHTV